MPQNTPVVTAPRDPAPIWPEGFVRVLRDAGAKEKAIPYCIGWVQRFFSKHPGRAEHELGRTDIEGFLSEIAAHPGINNWQVQQARNALELYYEKFRGIALSPRDASRSDDITHPNHVGSETPLRDPASKNLCPNDNLSTRRVYTRPAEVVNRGFLGNTILGKQVSGQSECNPPEGAGEAFSLSMQPVAFNPPEKGGLHLLCLGGSSGERFFHQVLIVFQRPPPRGWWHLLNPAAAVCFPRIPVNSDRGNNGKKQ